MTGNPFVNAAGAILYIITIAFIMTYGTKHVGPENSVLAPIVALSVFTLSAAVMGYIFGYQPFQLYFERKKKEAVNLFLQTVGVFAAVTAVILTLYFSGILS